MNVVVLCFLFCFSGSYGDIIFDITTRNAGGQKWAYCNLDTSKSHDYDGEVTVEEGDYITMNMNNEFHIQKSSCHLIDHYGKNTTIQPDWNDDDNKNAWILRRRAVKQLSGTWSCILGFGSPSTDIEPNVNGYTQVICQVKIVVKPLGYTRIPFTIVIRDDRLECDREKIMGPMRANEKFTVMVTSKFPTWIGPKLEFGHCFKYDLSEESNRTEDRPFLKLKPTSKPNTLESEEDVRLNTSMNDNRLTCKIAIDKQQWHLQESRTISWNNVEYAEVVCEIKSLTIAESNAEMQTGRISNQMIIIIASVIFILVVLIIIGQTIALLYFKSRAQRQVRLDSLITRNRSFDRNDQARYSAPPSRRSIKTNRAAADTDSHIYEMVGVNALYKDSGEMDIRNRPPLPLPGEFPDDKSVASPQVDTLSRPAKGNLMQSTLSLNQVSSTVQRPARKEPIPPPQTAFNKGPNLPPKPYDEESLPGSLRRPPKPTGPVSKCSTMPKMPANDPAFTELKMALRKRMGENASPMASPISTIDRKQPPKTPIKPRKPIPPPQSADPSLFNPLSPPNSKSLPLRSINPLSNQLKIAIGSGNPCTSPRPLRAPPVGGVNPLAPPIAGAKSLAPQISGANPSTERSPPTPKGLNKSPPIGIINPFLPNQATKTETPLRPAPPKKPMKPVPNQFENEDVRPGSPAESIETMETVSSRSQLSTEKPLPPIQQSQEDLKEYDSDEEWSYEPLDNYHIYNL